MLILLDQDGVLADFETEFLNRWRERYPTRPFVSINDRKAFYLRDDYPKELWSDIRALQTEKGFIEALPPIEGAIAAIRYLENLGHDVRICTTPLSDYENCVAEKFVWVERHLGREWTRRIIMAKDKTLIIGDILIDDRPSVEGTMKPSWQHVIFDTPYNQAADGKRLRGWANVQSLIGR